VFAELPRLLERAGPGLEGRGGSITALFTVLVEGEDHDEPVADAVRGILDGHVVLERRIAEAGRFPAVNVLRSLSRAAPGILSAEEKALLARARRLLALHADMADMVRLGAYRPGSDPEVDEAVRLAPRIEALLAQDKDEADRPEKAFAALAAILDGADGA
jgi:flagellum-specific ATP synthase